MRETLHSWNGVKTDIIHDKSADTLTLSASQDVERYIQLNKILRDSGDGYTPSRDMKLVGIYPPIIVEKILRETGINLITCQDQKALKRVLNEYPVFRASEGAL